MKTPKITPKNTVETNVSRQIMEQVKNVLQQETDKLFELIKKRDYTSWLMSISDVEVELDSMYDYFVHAIIESDIDKDKLSSLLANQDFYKRFNSEIWRTIYDLGEKAALYLEEQLGFPKNTLMFKYDIFAPSPSYGMMTDILGQYQFAIKTNKNLKEHDTLGDWIVTKIYHNKRLVLQHAKSGYELRLVRQPNVPSIYHNQFVPHTNKETIWVGQQSMMRLDEMLEIINRLTPVCL